MGIYTLFGANTNVGKTFLAASLLHAASLPKGGRALFDRLFYLKPVQTGYPADSDARFIKELTPQVESRVLYTFEKPLSPHDAAHQEGRFVADEELLQSVRQHLNEFARMAPRPQKPLVILETAGGVNSPVISGTLQSECYRPLRHPVILAGDPRLGGISATLSAFESLTIRGYDVAMVLLFQDLSYRNHTFLQRQLPGVPVMALPPPPPKERSPERDLQGVLRYQADNLPAFHSILELLRDQDRARLQKLDSLEERARSQIWWPFTQHKNLNKVTTIDSAHGDYFTVFNRDKQQFAEQFDACASWWTQAVGHGSSSLAQQMAYAAGRYGHVIFPQVAHEPAVELTELLLKGVGRNWASRVFFSDDGSTATEVALKMAFRYSTRAKGGGKEHKWQVLGLGESYHGDTIGAMNAVGPNVFNSKTDWYEPNGFWFEPARVVQKDGTFRVHHPLGDQEAPTFGTLEELFDPRRAQSPLFQRYVDHFTAEIGRQEAQGKRFGAIILEPVVHGANGMILVDPFYQKALVQVGKRLDIPVIFDEIFVGIFRLGVETPQTIIGETPDIACYGKILSGGMAPIAVTLAHQKIFEGFEGDSKKESLLHGHSYTAYPVGCWVALHTLRQLYSLKGYDPARRQLPGMWDPERVRELSRHPSVSNAFGLGTLLAFEYQPPAGSPGLQALLSTFSEEGVFVRPLGNMIYFMASLNTPPSTCSRLLDLISRTLPRPE